MITATIEPENGDDESADWPFRLAKDTCGRQSYGVNRSLGGTQARRTEKLLLR
jgi:hypothetical protein